MPVRARQSFTAEGRVISRGQLLSSRDPIVKGRTDLFDPVDDDTIETTRAAPGHKRATKKTAAKKVTKKTAAKTDDDQSS